MGRGSSRGCFFDWRFHDGSNDSRVHLKHHETQRHEEPNVADHARERNGEHDKPKWQEVGEPKQVPIRHADTTNFVTEARGKLQIQKPCTTLWKYTCAMVIRVQIFPHFRKEVQIRKTRVCHRIEEIRTGDDAYDGAGNHVKNGASVGVDLLQQRRVDHDGVGSRGQEARPEHDHGCCLPHGTLLFACPWWDDDEKSHQHSTKAGQVREEARHQILGMHCNEHGAGPSHVSKNSPQKKRGGTVLARCVRAIALSEDGNGDP